MLIEDNGVHKLKGKSQAISIVYISGDLGGGTATLGYANGAGIIDLTDGLVELNKQYKLEKGVGMQLYLSVAGATTPSIRVSIAGMTG